MIFHDPVAGLALPTIAVTVLVTLMGIRLQPMHWFGNKKVQYKSKSRLGALEEFHFVFRIFRIVCIIYFTFTVSSLTCDARTLSAAGCQRA